MQEEKLLKAIADLLDQKLEEKLEEKLDQKLEEKLDRKLEEKLDQKLHPIWQELSGLNKRVDTVSEQVNTLDKRFDVLEEKVNVLDEKVNALDERVTRNYDLLVEFYGKQQEENRFLRDELKLIHGKLQVHDNQIARNTADIAELKKDMIA